MKHFYFKSNDGNIYELFEVMDMTSNPDNKFNEFYKHLPKDIFNLLPKDVTNALLDNVYLSLQNLA